MCCGALAALPAGDLAVRVPAMAYPDSGSASPETVRPAAAAFLLPFANGPPSEPTA